MAYYHRYNIKEIVNTAKLAKQTSISNELYGDHILLRLKKEKVGERVYFLSRSKSKCLSALVPTFFNGGYHKFSGHLGYVD